MTTQSIYIVEDEIITAQSIASNLKKLGYQVIGISTTGTEAISQVLQLKPDLVLMDILLKKDDIDGIIAAQKIQEQLNIPIVYLTAHSDDATLERAKLTTPFGYILKPYSKKDLRISIKMALYKHHQELKLSEKEKLLSNILNSTKEGVIATGKDNLVTYINPAAEQLTGWKQDEAVGQKAVEIFNFINTKTKQLIPNPIEQVVDTGEVLYFNEDTLLVAKNGRQLPIYDSVAPIVQPKNPEIEGAVLIFAPADKSLFQNTWISEEGKELEILNPSTIQTKLAQLGNNLVDLVTHELRAPLTVVLSTSESLRRYRQKWTAEKQNSSFDKIRQAVEQMTQLLEDAAIWEQAGKSKLSFQPQQIDIVDFCETILSNLPISDRNRQLIFSHQLQHQTASLDPVLLKYALNNILLNAIKYSPSHSLVSLTVEEQNERTLLFKVQDRGIGIPAEEQSLLFDSFYRGSNVETIPGTGLGLAIAQLCIELHRGSISVESEVNVGTTFTILISQA